MNWKKLLLLNIILLVIGFLAIAYGSYYLKEQEVKKDEQRRADLYNHILDGASAKPVTLKIDFSKQISTGSPLIFGGAHAPSVNNEETWKKIKEVGISMIRIDLNINWSIRNTNLDDYNNNKNNIRDVDNWNKKIMTDIKEILKKAKKTGIKTMGIMDYSPPWLSYNNVEFGVPKDWGAYKDLVKKTYSYYRADLDYVEIWNEPSLDHFLDITGSPYSREEAYKMIFKVASEAIREVDYENNDGQKMKIGAPSAHSPYNTSLLENILKDKTLLSNLNFISYHNYDAQNNLEPSNQLFKHMLDKYSLKDIPIYITEWNVHSNGKDASPYIITNQGIIYSANRLINFIKMQIAGANYYSLDEIKKNSNNDLFLSTDKFGFYSMNSNKTQLMPIAKSWRILSKDMSLGKGESKIYNVAQDTGANPADLTEKIGKIISPDIFNTIGFVNVNGEYGTAIVNSTDEGHFVNIDLDRTSLTNYVKTQVYYASASNDATTPVYDGIIKAKDGKLLFTFYVPALTVVGMTFSSEKEWYENLNLPYIK